MTKIPPLDNHTFGLGSHPENSFGRDKICVFNLGVNQSMKSSPANSWEEASGMKKCTKHVENRGWKGIRGKICSDKFHLLGNAKVSSFKASNWFRITGGAGGDRVSPTYVHPWADSHADSHAKKRCKRMGGCWCIPISIQLKRKNLHSKQANTMKNIFITYLVFSFLALLFLLCRCFMELLRQMPFLRLAFNSVCSMVEEWSEFSSYRNIGHITIFQRIKNNQGILTLKLSRNKFFIYAKLI